jgi:hypothetical protein
LLKALMVNQEPDSLSISIVKYLDHLSRKVLLDQIARNEAVVKLQRRLIKHREMAVPPITLKAE